MNTLSGSSPQNIWSDGDRTSLSCMKSGFVPDIPPKLDGLLALSNKWKNPQHWRTVLETVCVWDLKEDEDLSHVSYSLSDIRVTSTAIKRENNKSHSLFVSAPQHFKLSKAPRFGSWLFPIQNECLKTCSVPVDVGTHSKLKIRLNEYVALCTSPEEISGAITSPVSKRNHVSYMSWMTLSFSFHLCKLLWKYLNKTQKNLNRAQKKLKLGKSWM